MRKSRFTESQIVAILKEADAGTKVRDLCRESSLSFETDSGRPSPASCLERILAYPPLGAVGSLDPVVLLGDREEP